MEGRDQSELVAEAKAGSVEAFEDLVKPHVPMLFAYGRAICGDYHDANDVVQATLIIAYRKLNHFFPEADFSTWLRAIARREALDARKKRARSRLITMEQIEEVYSNPLPVETSPRKRALVECLKQLSGRAGKIVRTHYFEGDRLGAIAKKLNMTLAAVKQLLYRARLSLMDCIRKRLSMEASP
jgi:RNA polymerase sigma-70 factor (ECF subfamily)